MKNTFMRYRETGYETMARAQPTCRRCSMTLLFTIDLFAAQKMFMKTPWVRSGPMVTAAVSATMSNVWDVYDPGVVSVYYEWETGLQQWNQLTAIQDTDGDIVSFDKPIQFAYTHTTANDRDGNATYDGQVYLMSYGGNGDFWGIPHNNTDEGRWFPLFAIADGVVMGGTDQYVIKAREMELTMADATGECSALTISAPAAAVPTGVVGSADIGTMPVVTADPSVIAGVNQ